ncbi:MAG: hypothetical protein WD871_14375 [Xanthobacteraceae bacterium]
MVARREAKSAATPSTHWTRPGDFPALPDFSSSAFRTSDYACSGLATKTRIRKGTFFDFTLIRGKRLKSMRFCRPQMIFACASDAAEARAAKRRIV